jgi:hypothetical protein
VSTLPAPPATVEKRVNSGVFSPARWKRIGLGQVRQRFIELEIAVGGRAAGMDDALGDALMVEVEDLLAKDEVLQQHRPALARLQLVLIVGNADALIGARTARQAGEEIMPLRHELRHHLAAGRQTVVAADEEEQRVDLILVELRSQRLTMLATLEPDHDERAVLHLLPQMLLELAGIGHPVVSMWLIEWMNDPGRLRLRREA